MHMSKDGIWVVLYPRSWQAGALIWKGTSDLCFLHFLGEITRVLVQRTMWNIVLTILTCWPQLPPWQYSPAGWDGSGQSRMASPACPALPSTHHPGQQDCSTSSSEPSRCSSNHQGSPKKLLLLPFHELVVHAAFELTGFSGLLVSTEPGEENRNQPHLYFCTEHPLFLVYACLWGRHSPECMLQKVGSLKWSSWPQEILTVKKTPLSI